MVFCLLVWKRMRKELFENGRNEALERGLLGFGGLKVKKFVFCAQE